MSKLYSPKPTIDGSHVQKEQQLQPVFRRLSNGNFRLLERLGALILKLYGVESDDKLPQSTVKETLSDRSEKH
jgi:hypothetical protein